MNGPKIHYVLIAFLVLICNVNVYAQGVLEELIVTATKREMSLQEVPVAVSVMTGEDFKSEGLDNNSDLAAKIPNLNVSSPFSAANPYITLRGVGNGGDFSPLPEGSVGVAFDGVTVIAQNGRLSQAFDLERVEVLRGPQGTLYGKNTTGGVISYISRKPGNDFAYNIDLTVGNYGQIDVEGGVDLPISDTLKLRLAGVTNNRDGYTDNLLTGEDLNDTDNKAGRGVLVWTPTDTLDVTLNIHGYHDRGGVNTGKNRPISPAFGGTGTDFLGFDGFANPDPFEVSIDTVTRENIDAFGGNLTADWDLGFATLTSVSGFERVERDQVQDFDYSINDAVEHRYIDQSKQFSQELRLTSNDDDGSRLRWIGGLFYFDSELKINHRFNFAAIATFFHQNALLKTDSIAAFANASFDITDRITITGGVRYSAEDKEYDFSQLGFPGATAPNYNRDGVITGPVVVNQPLISDKAGFNEWSGRATLDFKLTDDIMLYGSISRGFKSGVFQFPLFLTNTATQVTGPETIVAYEGGLKSTLFDGRARINLSGFLYNFRDQQVFTLNGLNPLVPELLTENADKVEILGMEADFILEPIDNLNIVGSMGWLPTAQYETYTFLEGNPGAVDLSGERIQYAPELDASVEVNYRMMLNNGWELIPGISVDYQSSHSADAVDSILNGRLTVPSWVVWNTSLQMAISDNLSLTVWGRNIFDKEYINALVNIGAFSYDMALFGEPRTFGATLSYNFN